MDKIEWCCRQRKGMKKVEPMEDTGREFLRNSDMDFADLGRISIKWKNIVGYYACYNALYAVLQKIGIKSEIHDCSIEAMKLIKGFEDEDYKFMNDIKKIRIDVQYYLKEPQVIDEKKIMDFILTCKEIFSKISFDEINDIRERIN